MSKLSYVRQLRSKLTKLNDQIDRLIIERKPYGDLAQEHARIRSLLAHA